MDSSISHSTVCEFSNIIIIVIIIIIVTYLCDELTTWVTIPCTLYL
jgi:hypothetical protein